MQAFKYGKLASLLKFISDVSFKALRTSFASFPYISGFSKRWKTSPLSNVAEVSDPASTIIDILEYNSNFSIPFSSLWRTIWLVEWVVSQKFVTMYGTRFTWWSPSGFVVVQADGLPLLWDFSDFAYLSSWNQACMLTAKGIANRVEDMYRLSYTYRVF